MKLLDKVTVNLKATLNIERERQRLQAILGPEAYAIVKAALDAAPPYHLRADMQAAYVLAQCGMTAEDIAEHGIWCVRCLSDYMSATRLSVQGAAEVVAQVAVTGGMTGPHLRLIPRLVQAIRYAE
jgi:hypothetical protein